MEIKSEQQQSESPQPSKRHLPFSRLRLMFLLCTSSLLVVILTYSWVTRDAMTHLPFLKKSPTTVNTGSEQKSIVDLRPWQTALAVAPLAVSAEEVEHAREAERLADHEVDQAFALALRQANSHARALTGDALTLSQKVEQLQQLVKDDQAQVLHLAPASTSTSATPAKSTDSDDLQIAKAQLGLDQDELSDAQQDLARASGDKRTRIQQELNAHEAAMSKYDAQAHQQSETAVISAQRYTTLAHRIQAWFAQRTRYQLVQQAMQLAQSDVTELTAQHNTLESNANSGFATSAQPVSTATRLAGIHQQSEQRQILSIYDDRIQTQQQLVNVYSQWSAQILLQHRTVLHLILQSLALIAFTIIIIILCDSLIARLLDRPALDRRRLETLRTILQLAVQFIGVLLVLFIIFGTPSQMPTILGLATAGLTVVLQDFIIAFFGWFVLMGKNGIRVGDTVEINGVSGEVTEIGLFRTMLLETGNWTDKGHPTGRHVSFINSFAIRGQYFNFSTAGQWMWDEISVSIPASDESYAQIERIHKLVVKETEQNAKLAEEEWKRSARRDGFTQFSAAPAVNLRPAAAGVDILVRYVTRASDRFETRNRLYQSILDVLRAPQSLPSPPVPTQPAS